MSNHQVESPNDLRISLKVPRREPCPFCRNIQGENQCAFVHRADTISSFVNPRQYEKGALLVIPNRHVATIVELEPDEIAALYIHAQKLAKALCQAYRLAGINIFQNNGSVAGQSVPHVHVHVVPRYEDSERGKIFREVDFEKTPFAERLKIAEEIQQAPH
ncbi:HIT family protein [Chloroflexi bacterium TSY]|nr:HIT family protein [Chloroflexi bacterium TSY]